MSSWLVIFNELWDKTGKESLVCMAGPSLSSCFIESVVLCCMCLYVFVSVYVSFLYLSTRYQTISVSVYLYTFVSVYLGI